MYITVTGSFRSLQVERAAAVAGLLLGNGSDGGGVDLAQLALVAGLRLDAVLALSSSSRGLQGARDEDNEAVAVEPPSPSSDDAVPEPAVNSVVIAPSEAGARRTALLRSAACSLPLEQLLCGCALNVELLQPDGQCYAPRR